MTLSGSGRRKKGLVGEREVRKEFEKAGFTVRALELTGDHLVICAHGLTLHLEVKRQERIQIVLWSEQAECEAPQGTLPIVVYRRSREQWRASMRLDDLLALLVANHANLGLRSDPIQSRGDAMSTPEPDEPKPEPEPEPQPDEDPDAETNDD